MTAQLATVIAVTVYAITAIAMHAHQRRQEKHAFVATPTEHERARAWKKRVNTMPENVVIGWTPEVIY